jgi:hypothetical protein
MFQNINSYETVSLWTITGFLPLWPSLYPRIFPLEFSSSAFPSRNGADLKLAFFFMCLSKMDNSVRLFCPVLSAPMNYIINRDHRVHAEWQWPLSGVHSIKGGKISPAQRGVGGARPPPFTLSTITYKVLVYTAAERADVLPLRLHPFMYSVVGALRLFVGKEWMSYSIQYVQKIPF